MLITEDDKLKYEKKVVQVFQSCTTLIFSAILLEHIVQISG